MLKPIAAWLVPIALAIFATGAASAAGDIGFAQSVQRNAVAELGLERRELGEGTRVRRKEVLATDAFGRLRLQFFDKTLLSVGPASRVKLDSFVVNADGTASSVLINAMRGAFRFASGASESRVYSIESPVATMGVRGTRFAFEIDGRTLRVSVSEGAVQVCPRGAGAAACKIARPKSDVVVADRQASLSSPLGAVAALAPMLGAPLSAVEVQEMLRSMPEPIPGSRSPAAPAIRGPDVLPSDPRLDLPGLGGLPSGPAGGLLRR